MLTIRPEQIKALEADRIRQFKARLRRHLEPLAPSCPDLEAHIDRGLSDARAFGLVCEKDVARFVEITCERLGGFPSGRLPKPALAILMTYGLNPSVKLDRYLAWAEGSVPARLAGCETADG